jgi:heme/copper-type cytochrome/quinol oxidase subunit 1
MGRTHRLRKSAIYVNCISKWKEQRYLNQTVFFIACLIIVPLAVHIRQWRPAALFAVTALVYAIFGSVNFINTQIILSSIAESEPQLHDTYYVVNPGSTSLNHGLIMAFFAALTWLQTRLGAMRFPRATRAFFWPLHLGLIGASSSAIVHTFLLPKPQRYIDYPEYIEAINRITSWALICGAVACLALTVLLIWSIALRWKVGR